jgi:hypothetical protein
MTRHSSEADSRRDSHRARQQPKPQTGARGLSGSAKMGDDVELPPSH